jgi:methyltransferase (TIGR00027 family)
MQAHAHSHTAEGAAFARAVGAHQQEDWLRVADTLAARLIRPWQAAVVGLAPLRALLRALYARVLPGMYIFHCVRTRYFDELFAERIASGVRQFVILGAGLDSRAYRFAAELRGARVFEVDHPASSARKQRQLRRVLPALPAHVAFVALDFEIDVLSERLRGAGFDASLPTFFLWEGVTMYLSPEAVDATLAALTRCAPGSTLAFEYLYADARETPERYFGAAEMTHYVAKRGEPYRFGLDPAQIDEFIAARGMRVVSHRRSEDFVRDHRARADWKPAHRMLDCWGAVHAEIVSPFDPPAPPTAVHARKPA